MIDIVFSVIAVILFYTVSYKITKQIIKNRSHPDFRLERFYIEKRKFSDGFVIEVSEDSLDDLDSCNSHYKYLKKQTAFKELKVTYKKANSSKRETLATWFKSEPNAGGIESIYPSRFNDVEEEIDCF